mgnify:CR=1 FL=1
MRPDIFSLVIICVCAIGGYLVVDFNYLTDEELGLYYIDLPLSNEIQSYTFYNSSNNNFIMDKDKNQPNANFIVINKSDEDLTLQFLENGDLSRGVEIELPGLKEERYNMFMMIAVQDILIGGIGTIGVILVSKIQKKKGDSSVEQQIL